jgi:hypothetical protein
MGWVMPFKWQAMTCKANSHCQTRRQKKRKGRLKLRWEDGVDNDVKALGKRNWKYIAWQSDEQKNVAESSKEGCGSKRTASLLLLLLLMMMIMMMTMIQSGQMDKL